MSEDRFIQLVQDNDGFEYYQAFRGDVDHVLGGKGDTYWYIIMKKGKVTESYIGKYRGDVWEDVFIKGSGSRGVPIDVKETKLSPSVNIKDGKNTVSQTGSLELTFSGGDKEASVTATFSKKLKDLAPGKYSVSVSICNNCQ